MNSRIERGKPSFFMKLAMGFTVAVAILMGATASLPASADSRAEDVNLALASGDNPPGVQASYAASWSPLSSINNGNTSTDPYGGWGTWGHVSKSESATYTWPGSITTSKSVGYYYTNVPPAVIDGDSGIPLPKDVTLEYLDSGSGEYKTVPNLKVDKDFPNDLVAGQSVYGPFTYSFDEITTTSLRMTLTKDKEDETGITVTEWEVYGSVAPVPIDPGEPDPFLWTQQVQLRTTPGADPTSKMPATIWVTPENGPTKELPVVWDQIPPEQYSTAGRTFTIKGMTAAKQGLPATPVEATVTVYAALNDEARDAENVSTITQPGVAPVFPDTVYLDYADGSRESGHHVQWEHLGSKDYAHVDDFGEVTGSIEGSDITASATWFVVEPSSNAPPVVSLEFQSDALNAAGWYTSAPQLTVFAQRGDSKVPIQSLQYRVDEGDWCDYTGPVKIDSQGTVNVEAKATDAAGRSSTQSQTIKVDTKDPQTTGSFTVDGATATVTLHIADGGSGAGVTRTVYSTGPSSNPKSNENTMWATYEVPVQISLSGTKDTWVHFYSIDAAGRTQAYQSINLGKDATIHVDSVTITGSRVKDGRLTLKQGEKDLLQAVVAPADASHPNVSWTSSNDDVVSVDMSGTITAVSSGSARITATADGVSGTIDVDVVTDLSALKTAIAKAEALDRSQYTDASLRILDTALRRAKEVVDDGSSMQKDIDAATAALNKALDELIKRGHFVPDDADQNDAEGTNQDSISKTGSPVISVVCISMALALLGSIALTCSHHYRRS